MERELRLKSSEYLSDIATLGLTYFDMGVWFHLLMIMTRSKRYGQLCDDDGVTLTMAGIAELLPYGCKAEIDASLAKLIKKRILAKDQSGLIQDRRMVYKGEISDKRRKYGRKGGEAKAAHRRRSFGALLRDAGLEISDGEVLAVAGMYRVVDMGVVCREAVEEHKVRGIGDVKRWLVERCGRK